MIEIMSDAPLETRSFEAIEVVDLQRLASIALTKLEDAFSRHPEKRTHFAANLLAICLCQGAADHFLHLRSSRDRGVNDFDLWAFYERQPSASFWNRSPSLADFGQSKFGRSPRDPIRYLGRRVDVFWRTISSGPSESALQATRHYFEFPRSNSALELRKKSAVLIWPEGNAGVAIWDPLQES